MTEELTSYEFTDDRGDVWFVGVDLYTRRKLKRFSGFDLNDLLNLAVDPEQLAKTLEKLDAEFMEDLLWMACESQAEQRGINQEAFFAMLAGNFPSNNASRPYTKEGNGCFLEAMEATKKALVNFTQQVGGEIVGRMWERAIQVADNRNPDENQKQMILEAIDTKFELIGKEHSANTSASLELATELAKNGG